MNINKGDLVKLTRKSHPERTVTDYVIGTSEAGDFYTEPGEEGVSLMAHKALNAHFGFRNWDVEVIRRAGTPKDRATDAVKTYLHERQYTTYGIYADEIVDLVKKELEA